MSMGKIRSARYRRNENYKERVTLNEHDHAIFRAFLRFKYLHVFHLMQITGRNRRVLTTRIFKLFQTGFLNRPPSQIERFREGMGSNLIVHSITPKATAEIGVYKHQPKHVTKEHIDHEILIADIVLAFQKACEESEGFEFLEKEIPTLPIDTKYNGKPTQHNLVPDYFFGFRRTFESGEQKEWWFFLEADKGTMNIKRGKPFLSSIYKKLVGYWHIYQSGYGKQALGIDNFRVLFVTSSKQGRAKNMAEATQNEEAGNGSKMFLFTTAEEFKQGNPLTLPWVNGKDVIPTRIID